MSRCFPFPPPGYESKPRNDLEYLLKEKHKEKKRRKEKKEKEKREGKERKDREKEKNRSKDKPREKKDKKEKHRDQDKKKHKHRDKDKKKISNERKTEEHTKGHNERKLGEDSSNAECLKDAKFVEELGRRIRDEESGSGSQIGEITGKAQRMFESMGSSAEMERSTGNGLAPNITIPEQRRRMGMASAMGEMGTGIETLKNSICEEERRDNGMGRPMVMDAKKKIEGKDKIREQKVDHGKGNGHEDRVREKMHKRKNKEKDKEKEKEKIRVKGEYKHKEQNKPQEVKRKEQVDSQNLRSSFTPEDNEKSGCADGSLKRKEINGFLRENEMRCNKLSRPASSPHPLLENGRKLDQSPIGSPHASGSREAVNMVKVESMLPKINKMNGMIAVQPPSAVLGAPENGKSFKKPPHPDEKYLSQILRIPKMEEWPESDNQDWLLNRHNVGQKPETKLEADGCPQVWASALRIESADVLALPYVVPY